MLTYLLLALQEQALVEIGVALPPMEHAPMAPAITPAAPVITTTASTAAITPTPAAPAITPTPAAPARTLSRRVPARARPPMLSRDTAPPSPTAGPSAGPSRPSKKPRHDVRSPTEFAAEAYEHLLRCLRKVANTEWQGKKEGNYSFVTMLRDMAVAVTANPKGTLLVSDEAVRHFEKFEQVVKQERLLDETTFQNLTAAVDIAWGKVRSIPLPLALTLTRLRVTS